jgi:hypothetical protein
LEHLKKLIKKNVPVHVTLIFHGLPVPRVAAGRTTKPGPSPEESGAHGPQASTPRPKKQRKERLREQKPERVEKPLPEGAKTLYLNIGKMKRLYAKELSQIFQDQLGITKDDIYGHPDP